MASQSDSLNPDDDLSEHNVGQIMDTLDAEEDARHSSDGTSEDSSVGETSVEQFRLGQELDLSLNKSVCALDWSCLSGKISPSGDEPLEFPLDAPSHAVSSQTDAPAEAAVDLRPVPPHAAVEPAPDVPQPADLMLSPVPPAMMITPISKIIHEADQVVPGAPLPPHKATGPRRGKLSFCDVAQSRSSPKLLPLSACKTGYTKPPLPRKTVSTTDVPILASMMSSALDLAALAKVSPLFERKGTNVPSVPQQEPVINKSKADHGLIKSDVKQRSLSTHTASAHTASGSALWKFRSERSDDDTARVGSTVNQIQSAKEEPEPPLNRRRKIGVVISKSDEPSPDKTSDWNGSSELDYNTPHVMLADNQQSDLICRMTSTPIWQNQSQGHQPGTFDRSISKISSTSSTPKKDRSRSQPGLETRSTTTGRRRRNTSCTVCPDWCLLVEGLAGNSAGAESSRKVSVVDKRTRKVTPHTCGVQGLLLPVEPDQRPLQKLAPFTRKCAITPPLYIVHPITGSVKILQDLAKGLLVRCYGIQKTYQTPDTSVEQMARFYCEVLLATQKTGAFLLAGYSYGGLVVFEMARQLEEAGRRVAALIMLDGSPEYVRSHIGATRDGIAPDSNQQHVTAVMESHLLLYFLGMYGPVQQPELVRGMLQELPCQEDRVVAAVGVSLGTMQVSSQARGRWLELKAKVDHGRRDDGAKVSVSHVAQDVIHLRRQQKALAFIQAASIAEKYEVEEGYRFRGDIHLVRIRSTTKYGRSLSLDYNLKALCTGTVHVHYVDGEHESMMESPHVESVTKAVNLALKTVMD